jgi:hypothetical protein
MAIIRRESEPGSSLRTSPTGRPHLTARERREKRVGPLGHAEREKKEERPAGLGSTIGRGEKGQARLG